MSDRAQYVILCEDLQARVFIYRTLIARGANKRRIRSLPVPAELGGGAGHAYVLSKYPNEVRALRAALARASTGLVVHLDADPPCSVDERHAQLAAALATSGQSARRPDEPIAELIPRRNIESWIYALDEKLAKDASVTPDETTEHPKLKGRESDAGPAAKCFAEYAKHGSLPPTTNSVPSLRDGLAELRRLR